MYLYMYSDGVRQSIRPPTESEQQMIRNDELRVFCIESGRFQEIVTAGQNLTWRNIDNKDR
jgi:hypothetical protein